MPAMISGLPSTVLLVGSGSHCGKVVFQCRIWKGGFAAVYQARWKETSHVSNRNVPVLGRCHTISVRY